MYHVSLDETMSIAVYCFFFVIHRRWHHIFDTMAAINATTVRGIQAKIENINWKFDAFFSELVWLGVHGKESSICCALGHRKVVLDRLLESLQIENTTNAAECYALLLSTVICLSFDDFLICGMPNVWTRNFLEFI